jgi:hypothetical protein
MDPSNDVYSSRGIAWHSKHKHVFHNTPSGANVSWALDFLFKIASGRVALTDASDQGTKGSLLINLKNQTLLRGRLLCCIRIPFFQVPSSCQGIVLLRHGGLTALAAIPFAAFWTLGGLRPKTSVTCTQNQAAAIMADTDVDTGIRQEQPCEHAQAESKHRVDGDTHAHS